MQKKLSLAAWIDHVGVKKVAQLLNVNESTVRHWRCGRCLPASSRMKEIETKSRGRVSYASMIDNHYKRPQL